MRKIKSLSMIGLLAIVSFSSCTEEAQVISSPIVVATKDSAVITGYASAELNLQAAGAEAIPAGTTMLVTLPYADLNPSSSGSWSKTITVGTDGKYSVKVPTNSTGVTVSITPAMFEYEQTPAYAAGVVLPKLKLTYSAVKKTVTVSSGQNSRIDISYASSTVLPIGYPKVSINGKAQADIDASVIGLENLPDGTKIIFTADGWADSTTVLAGKYSMSVPLGLTVKWSISKTILAKIWSANGTNPALSTYIDSNKLFAIEGTNVFTATVSTLDITSGANVITPESAIISAVSGTAKADLDMLVNGAENLPTGTKIYFYTSTWGATATVTNGNFSINVPAERTVNYYISTVVLQNSSNNYQSNHTFETSGSFYSGTSKALSLTAIDPANYLTFFGTAKADIDLSIAGLEYLPAGSKITFSTSSSSWTDVVTLPSTGFFSVNAPAYGTINYVIAAATQQKQTNGTFIPKTFIASGSYYNSGSLNLSITAIAN